MVGIRLVGDLGFVSSVSVSCIFVGSCDSTGGGAEVVSSLTITSVVERVSCT